VNSLSDQRRDRERGDVDAPPAPTHQHDTRWVIAAATTPSAALAIYAANIELAKSEFAPSTIAPVAAPLALCAAAAAIAVVCVRHLARKPAGIAAACAGAAAGPITVALLHPTAPFTFGVAVAVAGLSSSELAWVSASETPTKHKALGLLAGLVTVPIAATIVFLIGGIVTRLTGIANPVIVGAAILGHTAVMAATSATVESAAMRDRQLRDRSWRRYDT
jgi:hypothetical protein